MDPSPLTEADLPAADRVMREAFSERMGVAPDEALLDRDFLVAFQGVLLHRDGNPGYDGPDVWVADDWR